jgi:hypothetical protein
MRRWRTIIIFTVAAAFFAVIAFLLLRREEPSYAGRPLSSWVMDMGVKAAADPDKSFPKQETIDRAAHAMGQIGTNAIPYLLRWINTKPPAWKEPVFGVVNKIAGALHLRIYLWDKTGLRGYQAAKAFEHVHPVPDYAITNLAALMNDPDRDRAERAGTALGAMANKSFRALVILMTNGTPRARLTAIERARRAQSDARSDVPVIISYLCDPNENVATHAATTLGGVKLEPEICRRALTNALADPRYNVRRAASNAITRIDRWLADPEGLSRGPQRAATNPVSPPARWRRIPPR